MCKHVPDKDVTGKCIINAGPSGFFMVRVRVENKKMKGVGVPGCAASEMWCLISIY